MGQLHTKFLNEMKYVAMLCLISEFQFRIIPHLLQGEQNKPIRNAK